MTFLVDVIFGGPGREAPISRKSGAAIVAALKRCGYDVSAIDVTDRLDVTRLRKGAVVFNIIHGTYGEDGTLQSELELAGFSFIGSDADVSRLCMDKVVTIKYACRGVFVWICVSNLAHAISKSHIMLDWF